MDLVAGGAVVGSHTSRRCDVQQQTVRLRQSVGVFLFLLFLLHNGITTRHHNPRLKSKYIKMQTFKCWFFNHTTASNVT